MKNLFRIGLLVGVLVSCYTERDDTIELETTKGSVLMDHYVIEIDGCEYIESMGMRRYGLTHKGNCKYCKINK
tara:strand:- start:268 stop:486 length:219 start_codon:yes stop_codon:yes gene_type:complete